MATQTDKRLTVGERIRQQRHALKRLDSTWTQARVAKEVNLRTGARLSGADISRWEAGRHRPTDPNLAALAAAFGVPLAKFYNGDSDEPVESRLERVERKLDDLVAIIPELKRLADAVLADAQPDQRPAPPTRAARRGRRRSDTQ